MAKWMQPTFQAVILSGVNVSGGSVYPSPEPFPFDQKNECQDDGRAGMPAVWYSNAVDSVQEQAMIRVVGLVEPAGVGGDG